MYLLVYLRLYRPQTSADLWLSKDNATLDRFNLTTSYTGNPAFELMAQRFTSCPTDAHSPTQTNTR